MKLLHIAVLLFIFALLRPCAGRAEQLLWAQEPVTEVSLSGLELAEEGAQVRLHCRNLSDSQKEILFLIPKIDGVDTVFFSNWASEEWVLPPQAGTDGVLQLRGVRENTVPDTLSFRIACDGKLSAPIVLSYGSDDGAVQILYEDAEPSVFQPSILTDWESEPESLLIEDRISPEEAALLDYGQAWVCLNTPDGLAPFCRIPLQVTDQGEATALFEGIAYVTQEAPGFPLTGRQEDTPDGPAFRTDPITLTGESVYYATLQLVITKASDGSRLLSDLLLTSDELGGAYHQAPLAIADQAELMLRIMENSPEPRNTADIRTELISLEHPLSLTACDAFSLGDLSIYCEYFFRDGSDIVHPVYAVSNGQ